MAVVQRVEDLFHRVNSLLPEGQELTTVGPDTPAISAIELMLRLGYSQVPVTEGPVLLGLFSFRSFAKGSVRVRGERGSALELPVDEFLERVEVVDISAELSSILGPLNADGAVLVGSPDQLSGIVTPLDALLYLFGLASLFVQLEEIEQATREIIRRSVPDEELEGVIRVSLEQHYVGRESALPTGLLDMTYSEYAAVIGDGRNWGRFQPILGTARARVTARLNQVAALRNDVLHFRRELSPDERDDLQASRDWLLRKVQIAEMRGPRDD